MKSQTMENGVLGMMPMMVKSHEQADKDPRTYVIIGAAMEVHRHLGCGFLEPVYHEAISFEMTNRVVPYRREIELPVFYKGQRLNTAYRADFICFDSIVVEIKALARLGKVEEAQIINYLKATGFEVGLLLSRIKPPAPAGGGSLNFGAASLEYRRFALSKSA